MKKVLHILIIVEVITVFVGIPIDIYFEKYLPYEFQDYIVSAEASGFTFIQTTAYMLGLIVLLVYIIAWIGLWKLWRPARLIYTICWLCFIPLYLFAEPVVYYTPVGAIFTELGTLFAGMIFGVIYYSDLKNSFSKEHPEPLAAPDAASPRRRA